MNYITAYRNTYLARLVAKVLQDDSFKELCIYANHKPDSQMFRKIGKSSAFIILRYHHRFMRKYNEQIIWLAVLILLFLMNEQSTMPSFCLFKLIGINYCPGCGIGHAIHDVLHLQFAASLKHHLLGIPATCVLIYFILKPIIKKHSTRWNHNKCS